MQEMKERLEHKIEETKEAYPDKFAADQMGAGPSGISQAQLEEEEGARGKTPVDEVATFVSPGSPESDDIYDEMDREYQILERLYELYQQLAPDRPEGLRTPPVFSKHPEIRELGRQLRYRADEFDLHPAEKFQPAAEYFAGEGAAAPSPFVDPRDAGRLGRGAQPSEEPEMPPSRIAVESPPWTKIEELKRITEMAEKGLDASPAISGGVGMTTPKSPSTPRRPIRRDLRLEFDMESPPQYESPPGSPQGMPTPEFLMDPTHGLPQVVTGQMLEDMYAGKQAEYDAYIQAEMEAEKSLWPVLAPRAPTPPPPRVSPRSPGGVTTPQQRPSPRAPTPPSVGGPGVPVRTPGTPKGLPPSMRFQYTTPPKFRTTEPVEIPGEPEFEEFDPFQHEDIMFQTMPELVEADLDDFDTSMGSPQFELKEWYDPMKAMLEAEEEPEMIFDVSDEMGEIDLVPAEEDYRAYSPAITLQERLMGHEIPKEFFDPSRPGAKSKQVTIGSRKVQVARTSKPTTLAKETIREDLSGERFEESLEEYEDMINAEEEEFLNISLGDPDRTEYLKKMADEAQDVEALEEEAPPDLFDVDMSFGSPERPPRPPSPPVETPPFGPGREILLYGGTPEEYDENIFLDEEPEFLASPGMPSPPPPPTPPPPGPPSPETPPWAPPFETFYSEDIFQDEEPDFLASPGMPPGRTLEDDMREIGGPIQLPPSYWELPSPPPSVPVNVPLGPLGRPLGPGDVQVSPQRATGRGIPSPRMRQAAPVGTPEFDPAAFRRELMGHRVEFAGKERFQAGERMVPRRTPIPRQYFPIREHAGYEESMKLHREVDDYREMMSRLPPLPPPAPYPEELMGQERQGRFAYQETLLDQPLSPMESLPSPLAPKRGVTGWQTPPHLRVERPPPVDYRTPSPTRQQEAFVRMPPHISMISRGQLPFEEEGFMDLREEDVFPQELQDSYSSPRVPASMMVSPPPSMAIPTMTMDQQMNQAEQRALWQAQQIAERTPPRPSPPPRPPQRQPSPSPAPPPPEQRSPPPSRPPCARPPESEPKVLKRVQETTYSSEVYDPDSPENSRRWTKGRTMLEFNRPEEGDRGRPTPSPPPQGSPARPRGSPAPTTPPRQMPQPRPAMARVPRPAQQGGLPRVQGRRLPMRNIIEGEGAVLPKRRLFQDAGQQAPPSGQPPQPPRRVCPGAPKGEKVEIVEEFEETEHDYIPEHLRGYKWMDDPEADQFYETFKQQFR
ncbi:nascent polypeptide-associated complex subunit alpha, muscle-specific form-like [Coccinella septempunctata]|uniref:nascent polypeptide-associated complex subunit alpha, muscle-specific form-like n=1 Tax=Coccinella septempunctata TaxID=41139 RepID=UPI001D066D51|nr:nascent polypeptide-associated complex subunit alpha, muscle-specific form-like [Coccinella septempunctata]